MFELFEAIRFLGRTTAIWLRGTFVSVMQCDSTSYRALGRGKQKHTEDERQDSL